MADSFILYTASGSTDTFSIPFGYLDPAHVGVLVDGVVEAFTFPSASQAQITSGNPTASAVVKVFRTTPRDARQVVWQNASNLTATDLNTADLQLLYIVQESFDNVTSGLQLDSSDRYDALTKRIINAADPVDPQDVATKNYIDTFEALNTAIILGYKNDAEAAAAALPQSNFVATTAPGVSDDTTGGYGVGSRWVDVTGDESYICVDASTGAAVWVNSTVTSDDLGSLALLNGVDNDEWNSGGEDLAIVNGGTGASTIGAARTNLDVYSKAESDAAGGQDLYAEYTTTSTTPNNIPYDTSIPQNNEGAEILTLAITPVSATSKLRIEVKVSTSSTSNHYHISALFKDSDADALAVDAVYDSASGAPQPTHIIYEMTSGTTSEITFKVRAGTSSGTCTFNGIAGSARLGGTTRDVITIKEILT
ncbi:MAG: hypothetical protein KUG81_08580 [Gammaproteobacteria bacterium]|nr:hypothetical protein [Gammaproteobacteria bacterium]